MKSNLFQLSMVCLILEKFINIINYIKRIKNKNIIILMYAEK